MATVNYVFGAPGSGKTTFGAKLARKYKGKRLVYANFPCKYTILIKDTDLGYFDFSGRFQNCIILLDEVGISYNNRDFKKGLMSDDKRLRFWKLARHYGCEIWVFSQGWNDCDLKIRTLATNYLLCKKSLIPCFSVYKPVYRKVEIDENTHEPVDSYNISFFFEWKLVFRPKYYKLFDSYDAPSLTPYDITVEKYPWLESLIKRTDKR